jgi:hypothetical protein
MKHVFIFYQIQTTSAQNQVGIQARTSSRSSSLPREEEPVQRCKFLVTRHQTFVLHATAVISESTIVGTEVTVAQVKDQKSLGEKSTTNRQFKSSTGTAFSKI